MRFYRIIPINKSIMQVLSDFFNSSSSNSTFKFLRDKDGQIYYPVILFIFI